LEKVDFIIKMLREKKDTLWVADQLSETFSEGVLMEIREMSQHEEFDLVPEGITKKEKIKRQKYGTTRPYSDREKLEILENGLRRTFLEIQEVQISTFERIKKFVPSILNIIFVSPDDAKGETHTINLSKIKGSNENLKERFNQFIVNLRE
jgi:hypothetical protein